MNKIFTGRGHFRVATSLCFKARLSEKPLMWKSFFILMQMQLIFTTKILHLPLCWKWEFLELRNNITYYLPFGLSSQIPNISNYFSSRDTNNWVFLNEFISIWTYTWNSQKREPLVLWNDCIFWWLHVCVEVEYSHHCCLRDLLQYPEIKQHTN